MKRGFYAVILMTGGGISFIFVMISLGAATVFIFRKSLPGQFQKIFLEFAAGVMAGFLVMMVLDVALG